MVPGRWGRFGGVALAVVLVGTAVAVPAQSGREEAARALFEEGRDLYEAGRYGEAAEALEQALKRVDRASIRVLLASALARAGRCERVATLLDGVQWSQFSAGRPREDARARGNEARRRCAAGAEVPPAPRVTEAEPSRPSPPKSAFWGDFYGRLYANFRAKAEVPPEPDGMVLVPAGSFGMGCNGSVDSDCDDDEKPWHEVSVGAFWIDRTEVTVAAYQACVEAGQCTVPDTGKSCNWGRGDRRDHPVNCVDWSQADAYCRWAGKRLPTEAEWEKAARGTDGRKYPWGNRGPDGTRANWCDRNCNYDWSDKNQSDGFPETAPVGSFPSGASPYGALDMAGNVWEWVADWYGEYDTSKNRDPKGPGSGMYRVLRGGSWARRCEEPACFLSGRGRPGGSARLHWFSLRQDHCLLTLLPFYPWNPWTGESRGGVPLG